MPLPESFQNCLTYCNQPGGVTKRERFDAVLDKALESGCTGPIVVRRIDINGNDYLEAYPAGEDAVEYKPVQVTYCGSDHSKDEAYRKEAAKDFRIRILTHEELTEGE